MKVGLGTAPFEEFPLKLRRVSTEELEGCQFRNREGCDTTVLDAVLLLAVLTALTPPIIIGFLPQLKQLRMFTLLGAKTLIF